MGREKKGYSSGFSLLEVLAAATIFAVGAVASSKLILDSLESAYKSTKKVEASFKAEAISSFLQAEDALKVRKDYINSSIKRFFPAEMLYSPTPKIYLTPISYGDETALSRVNINIPIWDGEEN